MKNYYYVRHMRTREKGDHYELSYGKAFVNDGVVFFLERSKGHWYATEARTGLGVPMIDNRNLESATDSLIKLTPTIKSGLEKIKQSVFDDFNKNAFILMPANVKESEWPYDDRGIDWRKFV